MLVDIIRRIVPIELRQDVGLWLASQLSRSKLLLYPYIFLLCGAVPEGVEFIDGDCVIHYKGRDILCPKDGIFTSWEVLQDEVYEKYYRPKDGDVVVDIGAYVGMFTVKSSLQVGSGGSVIAVEPASVNLKYLKRNVGNLANVTLAPVAAYSSNGERSLSISKASPCHSLICRRKNETEMVETATLDNILRGLGVERVDFIKIDAEGSEAEILAGASDTLRNNGLKLAVASYHDMPSGEPQLPYIKRLLEKAGFRMIIEKGYIYAEN